jgi:hypothetical protein
MSNTSVVTYAESFKIKSKHIGEFIQEHAPHLVLINDSNVPISQVNYGPQETDRYEVVLVGRRGLAAMVFGPRYTILGKLFFDNPSKQATRKKWLLEVFGRERVDFFKELAEKLAKQFEVEIHIRLESE